MPKAFTDVQWRERDIRETLIRILAATDPAYLRTVDLVQFEQGLLNEVYFLVPCDEEALQHIEHYVHQHGNELYQMARRGTQLL